MLNSGPGVSIFGDAVGRKSTYFRHSLNATSDSKIMRLMQKGGLRAVGAYWIIVEAYGKALIDDDMESLKQEINARYLANQLGLRLDSCRNMLELLTNCQLIEAVWCKSDVSSVKLSIPNFPKYFGRYSKTETMKCPNKRKENTNTKKRKYSGKEQAPDQDLDASCQASNNEMRDGLRSIAENLGGL